MAASVLQRSDPLIHSQHSTMKNRFNFMTYGVVDKLESDEVAGIYDVCHMKASILNRGCLSFTLIFNQNH